MTKYLLMLKLPQMLFMWEERSSAECCSVECLRFVGFVICFALQFVFFHLAALMRFPNAFLLSGPKHISDNLVKSSLEKMNGSLALLDGSLLCFHTFFFVFGSGVIPPTRYFMV